MQTVQVSYSAIHVSRLNIIKFGSIKHMFTSGIRITKLLQLGIKEH